MPPVTVISKVDNVLRLQVDIPLTRDMMVSEDNILNAANAVGLAATEHLLSSFDSDGSPIIMGTVKMTSKGLVPKVYHTPFGAIDVKRHVYQTSAGGSIFCPLEHNARIILTSTPRFAAQISRKSAEMASASVAQDLEVNHNRKIAKHFVQRLSKVVAAGIQAKEEAWTYDTPLQQEKISTISIGLDGANVPMSDGSWRQAMTGTITLYDAEGKRLHTTYSAAAPEHGKETFKARFERDINHICDLYPNALRIGIADGAVDNWSFLERFTQKQTLDFYHATEYVADVANCLFDSDDLRKKWLGNRCHQLKNFEGGAADLLEEVVSFYQHVLKKTSPTILTFKTKVIDSSPLDVALADECEDSAVIEAAILPVEHPTIKEETIKVMKPFKKNVDTKALDAFVSYFQNNLAKSRMSYAKNLEEKLPIGSGVTESACKMIIKSRLCQSGMRWKDEGIGIILSLRTLAKSNGKWDKFWGKVNQYGFPEI